MHKWPNGLDKIYQKINNNKFNIILQLVHNQETKEFLILIKFHIFLDFNWYKYIILYKMKYYTKNFLFCFLCR